VPIGLVSGHVQHLHPYVLGSKEVVSFARRMDAHSIRESGNEACS
jgi:hypothetical protein